MGFLSPAKELTAPKTDFEFRLDASPSPDRTKLEAISTIGQGMLITGTVVCAGSVDIAGRVVGDVYAVQLTISEGGRVDGSVVAQDVVIQGAFKGTLYGNSVKLQGAAMVEGEVYNKSLSIEQNAVFEGVARRLDQPVVPPTMDDITAKKTQAAEPPGPQAVYAETATLELVPENIVSPPTGIDYEVVG